MTSLISVDTLLTMARNTISDEVKLCQFEPTTVVCYSDEESESDESDTGVQRQASFTEYAHLRKVDWCSYLRCVPKPQCGIECQCCREMDNCSVHEPLVQQNEFLLRWSQAILTCLF